MGYWGVKNLGYGIWAPLCHPPPVDEDQGVDDFLHDTEDSDNGYEDEAIICCRHSYKCMYIYYIQ